MQAKLLEMLSFFHNYCRKNGLTYYIVGGTMLGAVRHGGFIPWDDDIDVALPRPDYNRLLSMFTEKEEHYLLESPYTGNEDYSYSFAKLYDVETTLIERRKRNLRRGIYIDVFPLDGVGSSKDETDADFRKVKMANMLAGARVCAITNELGAFKNAAVLLLRLIPQFVLNDRGLLMKADEVAASFGYDESLYVANLMGRYGKKEIMEKRIFGKPTEYEFENITVDGVEHYDEFLTHLYGDWRRLPPEEERKSGHSRIEVDLNKSWMETQS